VKERDSLKVKNGLRIIVLAAVCIAAFLLLRPRYKFYFPDKPRVDQALAAVSRPGGLYSPGDGIEWALCIGGPDNESTAVNDSIEQTRDGGYILAGNTRSTGRNMRGNHGGRDIFIVKLDARGKTDWRKCYGGSGDEAVFAIQQTEDGGYIAAGCAESDDGDLTGNYGGEDAWILKLNAKGEISWQKRFGGPKDDRASMIRQTSDGGYIAAGIGVLKPDDEEVKRYGPRIWVAKLDSAGEIVWRRRIGHSNKDIPSEIAQTSDGGYIFAADAAFIDEVPDSYRGGFFDILVVKMNGEGETEWDRYTGGDDFESAGCVEQTSDGGYIVSGSTASRNGDVSEMKGKQDAWVVKLDSKGELEWQRSYGGSHSDGAKAIRQTKDGYIAVGPTESEDGDVKGHFGRERSGVLGFGVEDLWIFKLNTSGEMVWQKCLGGAGSESGASVKTTEDGGYIVSCTTDSNDGEVSGNNGGMDVWVVKLSPDD
jgi:hypothetical protein